MKEEKERIKDNGKEKRRVKRGKGERGVAVWPWLIVPSSMPVQNLVKATQVMITRNELYLIDTVRVFFFGSLK